MKKPLHLKRIIFILALALILPALACSCGKRTERKPETVAAFLGAGQCALPGEKYIVPLSVCLKDKEGLPVGGESLRLENAEGSDLAFEPATAVTDAGGVAMFSVTAGKRTGDNYLRIIPERYPEKALPVRFINGVRITGGEQEGRSGNTLPEPIEVTVVNSKGAPLEGIPVYISSSPGSSLKAKTSPVRLRTDASGKASSTVSLPDNTGASEIDIEISTSATDNPLRAIHTRALSINFVKLLINVFGGLALFIFGMKLMSDGLTKIAGEKMKSVLHFCSNNRFVAVIAGALVTAVVQSSSATTVMVIGFVNAGLLTLAQSIGIIFGANIGTTITAQIVAFNVSEIAMPAIIIGLVLLFIKWQKLRGWGDMVLGFGLLFFGMAIMSKDLAAIGTFNSFIQFFRTFNCAPVNGVMPFTAVLGAIGIGVAVTMIIQSSAAAAGIVIALGASGLINLYTGVVLILGSNIGTTVTAQLAAIPANRLAKQAALAHTLFNVFGVVIIASTFWINWRGTGVPVFFYIVNTITEGNAFALVPQNIPRHIANAHTVFNILTTLCLLPFTNMLAALCSKLIPIDGKKIKYQYLEPHLLDTPSLAINQAAFALRKMLKKSWKLVIKSVDDIFIPVDLNADMIERFGKREERIDRYQHEIMEYLAQIMRRNISAAQSGRIPPLMHCANDAERMADRAGNIVELTRRMNGAGLKLSEDGVDELRQIFTHLNSAFDSTMASLENPDHNVAHTAVEDGQVVAQLADKFEAAHIRRLQEGRCSAAAGIIYVELLAELVAIARHISNIAERSVMIKEPLPLEKHKTAHTPASAETRKTPAQPPSSTLPPEGNIPA